MRELKLASDTEANSLQRQLDDSQKQVRRLTDQISNQRNQFKRESAQNTLTGSVSSGDPGHSPKSRQPVTSHRNVSDTTSGQNMLVNDAPGSQTLQHESVRDSSHNILVSSKHLQDMQDRQNQLLEQLNLLRKRLKKIWLDELFKAFVTPGDDLGVRALCATLQPRFIEQVYLCRQSIAVPGDKLIRRNAYCGA